MTAEMASKIWDMCSVAYEPPLPRGIRRAGFVCNDEQVQEIWRIVTAIPADADANRRSEWIRLMSANEA